MVYLPRQCMGLPILIYDKKRNLIAETIVTGYGKEEMYIEVSEGLENTLPGTLLRLLILHPDSVSEFSGKLTSIRQGIYEISIHGQRKREARNSPRFLVRLDATVRNFVVDSKAVRIRNPIKVKIMNISSTGISLQSKDLHLSKGVMLSVEFTLLGKSTMILCKVIREPSGDDEPHSFGCQIIKS